MVGSDGKGPDRNSVSRDGTVLAQGKEDPKEMSEFDVFGVVDVFPSVITKEGDGVGTSTHGFFFVIRRVTAIEKQTDFLSWSLEYVTE